MKKIKNWLKGIYFRIKQRKYIYKDHKIKYMLKKQKKSDKLVVVFSAFPAKNDKARYNYYRTLHNQNINKLFILDDLGYENRGTYYLGENMNLSFRDGVINLINNVKIKYKFNEIIFSGTSKGAWSSLYFGLTMNCDKIIVGSPQYYLADYLNIDNHKKILEKIIGNNNFSESEKKLNELLKDLIYNSKNKSVEIFLQFSKEEEDYFDHIFPLINDLQEQEYNVSLERCSFKNHNDIGLVFPNYLIKNINL